MGTIEGPVTVYVTVYEGDEPQCEMYSFVASGELAKRKDGRVHQVLEVGQIQILVPPESRWEEVKENESPSHGRKVVIPGGCSLTASQILPLAALKLRGCKLAG
ncbi:MAG TPA: hypothetical protein VGE74_25005 [Gemmata sp.]